MVIDRKEILEYVKNKYQTQPEYLWKKYPNDLVLRHSSNKKWYAVIMNVPKERLGLEGKEEIDIINLKCDPEMIGGLRKEKGVIPGYHMNKEYWISVLLDGSFSKKRLLDLIDFSFEITK